MSFIVENFKNSKIDELRKNITEDLLQLIEIFLYIVNGNIICKYTKL